MNRSRWRRALLVAPLAFLLLTEPSTAAQPPPQPARADVAPAIEGILDAFASHPIVGLGDYHGLAQELDFYAAIVRDPRFAAEVGNLVVEFGSAQSQKTLDRYLSGEAVPYGELRKVWTDTAGGGWTYLGYMNLLAQVRATNLALPAKSRIRVWLGDPPIDWSRIHTKAQFAPYELQRDAHPAALIQREILAKGKKALVIYGGHHLHRDRDFYVKGAVADPRAEAALRGFFADLARGSPDYTKMTPERAEWARGIAPEWKADVASFGDLKSVAFRGRIPDVDLFDLEFSKARAEAGIHLDKQGKIDAVGFKQVPDGGDRSITDRIEETLPNSVFYIEPYAGFINEAACNERFERSQANRTVPALIPKAVAAEATAGACVNGEVTITDAVLYLGPAASLTMSPKHPDIYLDEAYRREESRRRTIYAEPLPRAADMRDFPVTAKPWR